MAIDVIGIVGQALAIERLGLIQSVLILGLKARAMQDRALVVVGIGVFRVNRQGRVEPLDGDGVLALLEVADVAAGGYGPTAKGLNAGAA
jgi:hypothetical protein